MSCSIFKCLIDSSNLQCILSVETKESCCFAVFVQTKMSFMPFGSAEESFITLLQYADVKAIKDYLIKK